MGIDIAMGEQRPPHFRCIPALGPETAGTIASCVDDFHVLSPFTAPLALAHVRTFQR